MLIVQCLADDVILSYHISLPIIFVCFAGVSENPQMVKGEGLRVKGLFWLRVKG